MIAIIDYDTGNLRSVRNALRRLCDEHVVTDDHAVIRSASHVLLPGVGEASSAMEKLRQRRLDALIPTLTMPVLGICIGMQLMCRDSEEGNARCMGIFDTSVVKLIPSQGEKIPHVGWDTVRWTDTNDEQWYYYVHSFAAQLCPDTVALTDYCTPFSAALRRGNFIGVQFHPEKSGPAGAELLKRFLSSQQL